LFVLHPGRGLHGLANCGKAPPELPRISPGAKGLPGARLQRWIAVQSIVQFA